MDYKYAESLSLHELTAAAWTESDPDEGKHLFWRLIRALADEGARSADPKQVSEMLSSLYYIQEFDRFELECLEPFIEKSTLKPETVEETRRFLASIRDIAHEGVQATSYSADAC